MKNILVTGGYGFIGSHFVNNLVQLYNYKVVVLDALTYAANKSNITVKDFEFVHGSICDVELVKNIFKKHDITHVINFAAETHVDNSIANSDNFVNTNILGTVNLLNAAKEHWQDLNNKLFYQISTDEVFGSIEQGSFTEQSPYAPQNPYSASKASADFFVKSYGNTYKLPTIISNCSNNFGPHQHPEKLIPKVIHNLINKNPIPVYGNGENVRDWLWVEDHVEAIKRILFFGESGQTYNIGGGIEFKNITLIKLICSIYAKEVGCSPVECMNLITYVDDRKGHDARYSTNSAKLKKMGWQPSSDFTYNLTKTVKYYLKNSSIL